MPQNSDEDCCSILCEAAIKTLKEGKLARDDNIPAELVQAGGETMFDMTSVCNMEKKAKCLPIDIISGDCTPKEKNLTAMPKLSNNQSH